MRPYSSISRSTSSEVPFGTYFGNGPEIISIPDSDDDLSLPASTASVQRGVSTTSERNPEVTSRDESSIFMNNQSLESLFRPAQSMIANPKRKKQLEWKNKPKQPEKRVSFPSTQSSEFRLSSPENNQGLPTFFYFAQVMKPRILRRLGVRKLSQFELTKHAGPLWEKLPLDDRLEYKKEARFAFPKWPADTFSKRKSRSERSSKSRADSRKSSAASSKSRSSRRTRQTNLESGRPKGPRNSFNFFQKAMKALHPEKAQNQKELGQQWRELAPGEKAKYKAMAEADKERYRQELRLWQQDQ